MLDTIKNNLAPVARIILRYGIGAGLIGSQQVGAQLSADPDLVFIVAAGLGVVVECGYVAAKRFGWAT